MTELFKDKYLYGLTVIQFLLYFLVLRENIQILFACIFPNNLTNIENEVAGNLLVFCIIFVDSIIILFLKQLVGSFLSPKKNKLEKIIKTSKNWLLSGSTFWDVTIYGNERKIANTVEGLFSIIYSSTMPSDFEKGIVKDCAVFLLNNVQPDGLHSFTLNKATTHCSAMGLFVLQEIRSKELFKYDSSQSIQIDVLKNSLVNSLGQDGWGFLTIKPKNENEVRLFSTIWALRGLNKTDFAYDDKFSEILMKIVRKFNNGKIGYTYKDTEKVAISSLFLILLYELQDKTLFGEVFKLLNQNQLIDFLLVNLSKGHFSEWEEFRYPLNSKRNMPWVHISGALAIHALALVKKQLSIYQLFKFNRSIIHITKYNLTKDGYFFDSKINFEKNNSKIFPTAYYISGLYFYINS